MVREIWPNDHPANECSDQTWVSGVGSVCLIDKKMCQDKLRNAECEKGYTLKE